MAVNIHITIIELNALHTKRQNLFQELDVVIHLLMEAKHWGLRKSRKAKSLDSFFFQAEDGIRDGRVTGVQTCALPIFTGVADYYWFSSRLQNLLNSLHISPTTVPIFLTDNVLLYENGNYLHCCVLGRSEERRVGKECRSRWLRHS